MISPAYNISGFSTATVSLKIQNFGTGNSSAQATVSVSYDGGNTWDTDDTASWTATSSYVAKQLTLSKTFTNNVVIKVANTGATGDKSLRVQNLSFTVTE